MATQIEVLYFEGCPTWRETVERVERTVERLGVDAGVEAVEVESDQQARDLGFVGSPSVRVDGEDIEPGASAEGTVGLGCRVYPTEEGMSGMPPVEMVEAALLNEEYESGPKAQSGRPDGSSGCCCGN